jgi:hypothetical protein
MHRCANVFENDGFRLTVRQLSDVIREAQVAGDLTRSVMITCDQEDRYVGIPEASHPVDKIEACVVILPVTIVEITRQEKEADLFFESQVNEAVEGTTSGTSDLFYGGTLIAFESPKWAIQMNIGGMQKSEHGIRSGTVS